MKLPEEQQLKRLSQQLTTKESWDALANIVEILGGTGHIEKLAEIICTKHTFAETVKNELKDAILKEAGKKGTEFQYAAKIVLSDYYTPSEPDKIFKSDVAKIDLMLEQILEDAVVMDTLATPEIQDALSNFTKEEQKSIFNNISDKEIKEFVETGITEKLNEYEKKYKWFLEYSERLKRLNKKYPVRF